MRALRSVTLQPIATLSRTLKLATDFLALHCTGFWPLIFARSPMALSSTLRSASASPTPMFSVIFVIRGTAIGFVTFSCFMS